VILSIERVISNKINPNRCIKRTYSQQIIHGCNCSFKKMFYFAFSLYNTYVFTFIFVLIIITIAYIFSQLDVLL